MTELQRRILEALSDWKSEPELREALNMTGRGSAGGLSTSLISLGKLSLVEFHMGNRTYRTNRAGHTALSH